MPHHWSHLNTAWERLSTALPLPLAFMCPRALCKYTILDLDLDLDYVLALVGFQNIKTPGSSVESAGQNMGL